MLSQENIEQTLTAMLTDENTNMNANTNAMPPEDESFEPPPPYMQSCFLRALGSWKTTEPLDDKNWVAWKAQMTLMLRVNKVWGHCDGTIIPPEVNEPCAFDKWDTADEVAKLLISGNIKSAQFMHVAQAITAKQMWDNLTSVHEMRGQQSITALRCTLYHTKAVEGDDIVAHMNTMRSYQVTLHQMGLKVNDEDFKSILVSSLPITWDAFTASYLGSQTGNAVMTSQELVAIIRDEYNHRKTVPGAEEGQDEGNLSMTMTAQLATGPQGKKRACEEKKEKTGSKKRTCAICFHDNHVMDDCFHKGKPKCNNCGKLGHKTLDCWSLAAGKKTKNILTKGGKRRKVERTQQVRNVKEDEEMSDATYVAQQHTSPDDTDAITSNSWLADSATSSHILNKREAYRCFTSLHTHVKGVGNVLVPVEGKGSIELKSWVNEKRIMIVLQNVLYVPSAPNSLASLTRLDESGGRAILGDGTIQLYDKTQTLIAVGRQVEQMYLLNVSTETMTQYSSVTEIVLYTWAEWHCRFRHVGISGLQQTLTQNLVDGLNVTPLDSPMDTCDACIQAKQTCALFLRHAEHRAWNAGELTHTDLWEA